METRFLSWEKELYRAVNTVFLACIAMLGAGSYLGVGIPGILHYVVATLILAGMMAFSHFSVKERIFLVLALAGCLVSTIIVTGPEKVGSFLAAYGNWFVGGDVWKEEWTTGYELMQVFWIVLFCYLLQMLIEKNFKIKLLEAGVLLGGVLFCYFSGREVSKEGMVFGLCYFVMLFTEWTQLHWNKVKSRSIRYYMLWMTPLLVLYLVVLMQMPVPEKPYDWQFVKVAYHKVSEALKTFSSNIFSIGKDDFDTFLSGFSDEAGLGAGFQTEQTEVMTVKKNDGQRMHVYLTGKVFDTFDGRQWTQSKMDFDEERYADAVRMWYAIKRYDEEYRSDYIFKANLDICYLNFNSRYLFAPLKTYRIRDRKGEMQIEESDGSLQFSYKAGYGTEYEIDYYQMNVGKEAFYEFLESEKTLDEAILQKSLLELKTTTGKELTIADMQYQEQQVYNYCTEDIRLSKEVSEFLEQFMSGAESDIDRLRIIEKILSQFTYTNTPGALPETVTDAVGFLDYFLLESRQGYCSHFATAFVLLARAAGFPARYVQGYCVPLPNKEVTVVTSDMAHAWPEVYLKNIGWIPFEPTPGYEAARYNSWVTRKEKEEQKKEETPKTESFDPVVPDWEDEEEDEEVLSKEMLEELKREQERQRKEKVEQTIRILLFSTGFILVVGLFIVLLDRLLGSCRYRKMTMEQKYLEQIRRSRKLLYCLGLTRKESETLEEFASRVHENMEGEAELHFLEVYESFLYGNLCVDEALIQAVKEEQEMLLRILKQRKRWSYLYYCVFIKNDAL